MPTQKAFKQRVRARMAKTGEAYTSARAQLLRKAEPPAPAAASDATTMMPAAIDAPAHLDPALLPTSDDALVRATGRGYRDWFAELDAWGATAQSHTRIAAWLAGDRGVDGWWAQTITVGYERARGMRAPYQAGGSYQVGVTRTIRAGAEAVLAAFTDPAERERWLPGAVLARRPSRAAGVARFDWADPASRLVVFVEPKGASKATVSLAHERLPDPEAVTTLRRYWQDRLDTLQAQLER